MSGSAIRSTGQRNRRSCRQSGAARPRYRAGSRVGEHPPGFLEQGAPQIGFRNAEAGGQPGQMPNRIDRRLGDADLAVVEEDLAVGTQGPVGKSGRSSGCRFAPASPQSSGGCRYRADMIRKDLPGQMAPRVERHNFRRSPHCGAARSGGGGGIGKIRPMVTRQHSRRHGERTINRVSAGIGSDRVTVSWFGRARYDRPAFGRGWRTPTQPNCAPTGGSGVGSQPDMTRCGVLHALVTRKDQK